MSEHGYNGYMCFADFEFTCGGFIDNTRSEMLSVGIVICSPEHQVAEKFYQTARPCKFHRMTKQCRTLTGLTQPEINASPDSNEVLGEVVKLMEKYEISRMFVWGNFDKPGLNGDANQHRRAGKAYSNISAVCRSIVDIQQETTTKMGLPQAVSISELAAAFDYVPETGGFHNALNDAEALYAIHKNVWTSDLAGNEKFLQLKKERLDKMAAIKAEAEERLRQEAFSLPLSPEEQTYYSEAVAAGNTKAAAGFVFLRCKFVRAFSKYPDETSFVFAVFDQPHRVKVFPEQKFRGTAKRVAARWENFRRSDFGSLLIEECKKLQ